MSREFSVGAALPPPPSLTALDQARPSLFLDVDGTLVEFASRPEDVMATEHLVALLLLVTQRLHGALALLSGRQLPDLDRIFDPWQPWAAAVHGAVVRGPHGVREHQPDPDVLASVRREAVAVAARFPGAWVEDKGQGVAVHFRQAPQAAAQIANAVDAIVQAHAPAFTRQPGQLVEELRVTGFDKGNALRELMAAPPFLGTTPVVAGDDLTDEHAFAAATELGGFGVLVGESRPTGAQYVLPDPAAVRRWLTQLVEEGAS